MFIIIKSCLRNYIGKYFNVRTVRFLQNSSSNWFWLKAVVRHHVMGNWISFFITSSTMPSALHNVCINRCVLPRKRKILTRSWAIRATPNFVKFKCAQCSECILQLSENAAFTCTHDWCCVYIFILPGNQSHDWFEVFYLKTITLKTIRNYKELRCEKGMTFAKVLWISMSRKA